MSKILLIEDEEDIQLIVCEILELEQFEVICAADGQAGLAMAREHRPDFILCDVAMPELDGHQVLEQIRQDPVLATTPFVFITAKAEKHDVRLGMHLGADDYLTKPFSRDELLDAIAAQLKKQRVINQCWQQKLNQLSANITLSLPHELHTPLAGIMGITELLMEEYGVVSRDEAMEMLSTMRESATRLYRLTKNFLLYAELELLVADPNRATNLLQNRVPADLPALVSDVATQVACRFQRLSDLHLAVEDVVPDLDSFKLEKVVEEIVDNAFKFSLPGTPVQVMASLDETTVHLEVINRGRGLTPEQISRIGAYQQFDRNLYEQQGAGLGLAIAQRLLQLHGGQLEIRSIPGEKTIVQMTIPFVAVP